MCFFLPFVETAVFFGVDVFFAGGWLAAVVFAFGGGLAVEVSEEGGDWVWAKLSPTKRKIPARTETAELRTQTLPSAGNWHP